MSHTEIKRTATEATLPKFDAWLNKDITWGKIQERLDELAGKRPHSPAYGASRNEREAYIFFQLMAPKIYFHFFKEAFSKRTIQRLTADNIPIFLFTEFKTRAELVIRFFMKDLYPYLREIKLVGLTNKQHPDLFSSMADGLVTRLVTEAHIGLGGGFFPAKPIVECFFLNMHEGMSRKHINTLISMLSKDDIFIPHVKTCLEVFHKINRLRNKGKSDAFIQGEISSAMRPRPATMPFGSPLRHILQDTSKEHIDTLISKLSKYANYEVLLPWIKTYLRTLEIISTFQQLGLPNDLIQNHMILAILPPESMLLRQHDGSVGGQLVINDKLTQTICSLFPPPAAIEPASLKVTCKWWCFS